MSEITLVRQDRAAITKPDGRGGQVTHGHAARGKLTRTYRAWNSMRSRCQIPSATGFERYGGAGVTVCDRWQQFENFLADMGECPPGLTLDRERNSEGYAPGNCRWATRTTQAQNRTNAHWIEFGGERLSVTQWARRIGINKATLYERLKKRPLERALTERKRP